MDKSLDEIIKSKPRGGRSRRGRGRQQILGTTGIGKSPTSRARRVVSATAATSGVAPAEKIIVSNLPIDVNEAQVKELFHTTVGPTKEVTLNFDANGKSKGIASVTFQKKGDGTQAFNQYNGRLIDGKRAMKIEVVVDPASVKTSLVSRVAPAGSGGVAPMEGVQRTGRPGRRRGARRGGGGKRPEKSVADLDAEMEDYTQGSAPAPAATVA